jgi:hypothetical protein
MLRVPGLLCAAALLLSGCELFSTREFRPKPSEIRILPGLAHAGDSIAFRATESVWRAGASAPEKALSVRRIVFTFAKDSLSGADTLKVLTLRVVEESTGVVVEQGRRLVRFSSQGVVLPGTATGGGARFFPLKAAAPGPSAAADSDGFLALPALLIEGWSESVPMGILEVKREQTSVDTLAYQGRSEEAWGIAETVVEGGTILATGKYWYGASGLLRAEQTWDDFGWRGDNGAPPPKSQGPAAQKVSLRRALERL